jgi:hypothetical protein
MYVTASGKYPERLKSPELTPEIIANINKLLLVINNLLKDLGIKSVKVSSGFRPKAVNAATPGASKKSNHMKGLAVDLEDVNGKLDALFVKNIKLLNERGIYLESPPASRTWSHLQIVKTKNNPFIP